MKKFISGIVVGIGISVCSAALAVESLQAVLFPSKVVFHTQGQSKELQVSEEEPILNVNNKTYIPLRLFSESVGAEVDYREPTTESKGKHEIDIRFPINPDVNAGSKAWTLIKTDGFVDGILADISGISFGRPSIDYLTKTLSPTLQFKNSSKKEIEINALQVEFQILKVNTDGDEELLSYKLPVLKGKVPASSWFDAKLPAWDFKDKAGNFVNPGTYAIQIKAPDSLPYFIEGSTESKTISNLSKFKRWEYELTLENLEQLKNNDISVSDLVATYDKYLDSTKVTGHLTLNTQEASYVNAVLEFYDATNQLLGTVDIDDDFRTGINKLDIRGVKDFSNFSKIVLKVRDVHPPMKSHITSLFVAADHQDRKQIEKIIDFLPLSYNEFLLLDLVKWSFPNHKEQLEYILPTILKRDVNVNAQDKGTGYTALMYSSIYANNTIKLLIEAGADVKLQANDGTTALLLLVTKGEPELVKLLLDKGADPNAKGINEYTPILAALRPLFANYTENTVTTVKYLLDAGAKLDIKDPNGLTPLQIVEIVPMGSIKTQLTSLLVDHGAR